MVIISAFQADDAGSIPVIRSSIKMKQNYIIMHRYTLPKLSLTIFTLFAFVFLFADTPVNASNAWGSWHWAQNPGGGLERWIAYHDHTDSTVYPSSIGVNHNAAIYYNADNYVKPYRIDGGSPKINFYSDTYNDPSWYGITTILSYSGSHMLDVEVKLDESDSLSDSQKHSLICQEAGHALSLDHQGGESCMNDNAWYEDADSHDHATIKSTHNHTD